jgi:lysozyme
MKLGAKGAALIKSREQLRLRAYKATPAEKWYTIGWGHTGPEIKADTVWVLSQAEEAFARDTGKAATAVMKNVDVELTQNQFDALVAFTFNVGADAEAHSTLCKLLNRRDFAGAANEFAKWNHQDGKVLPGLTVRREQERVLFTTP